MDKLLTPVIGLLCASLMVIGCETTNQDYSHSTKVVDAMAVSRQSQRPAVRQQQASALEISDQSSSAYNSQPLSAGSVSQSNKSPVQIEVYNPSEVPAPTPALAPVAPEPAGTGVGVVRPYVPDSPAASDTYRVVKGDTLYSIAFRYGLDYRTLAQNNGIAPPYNIAVGQVIKLDLKTSMAPTYTVKRGDTLYSIAKANGQSVAFLAGVNNLSEPYTLRVGQVLNLARTNVNASQTTPAVIPVAGQTQSETDSKARENVESVQQQTAAAKPAAPVIVKGKTRKVSGITWMWPTQGKVIEQFSLAERGNKGIDIAGTSGQQVLAASDGQVVYAGNALRGYGNLIIINHANEFLSAYAHNDALLVSEGQKVVIGQQIARMGSTDAKSVRLHFEIRYRGQSVNPLSYLPK